MCLQVRQVATEGREWRRAWYEIESERQEDHSKIIQGFWGLKFRVNCDEIQSDEEAADGFYTKA